MAATIEQIARMAQVSRGTVDRVLHNRGRVSPEAEERIWSVAKQLNYTHKRRNKRQAGEMPAVKLGIITQLAKASFMAEITRGIRQAEMELSLRGVNLLIRESQFVNEEEQLAAIDALIGEGVQGIAIMPLDSAPVRLKLKEAVEEKGIPVVTFNSDIAGVGRTCFIGLDNWKSGALAAGLMAMLTGGEGKVLVITGYFSNSANNMRVDGFVAEVKDSFPGLDIVGVQGSFDDAAEVEKITMNALETYPGLAGILIVSSGQEGVAAALEKSAPQVKPHVIIYDLLPGNKQLLQDGVADFLIDQEGFLQGYQALITLADLLQHSIQPEEYQYTDINIRTKYNI